MIIRFSVENFRSFRESQSIRFVASSDRSHLDAECVRNGGGLPHLLKTAVVFGPNSSGKSNFMAALRMLRVLVVNSASLSEADFARLYMPFAFAKPVIEGTRFDIDVLLDDVRYHYVLSYNVERITVEQLLVYRNSKSQRWIGREFHAASGAEHWRPFSPSLKGPREVWRKATGARTLYLTTAARAGAVQIKPLFDWFASQVDFGSAADGPDGASLRRRLLDPSYKQLVLDILRSAGIPVADIRVGHSQEILHAGMPLGGLPEIEFLHGSASAQHLWRRTRDEGAGVHRLVRLLLTLLQAMGRGHLVLLDDFDISLHPMLARFLIDLTREPRFSRTGAQLLLVSHNMTLMDLELLRRDEIWLMAVDGRGASRLSPLSNHNPRKHELVAKVYLQGRYGAVPNIESADGQGPPNEWSPVPVKPLPDAA